MKPWPRKCWGEVFTHLQSYKYYTLKPVWATTQNSPTRIQLQKKILPGRVYLEAGEKMKHEENDVTFWGAWARTAHSDWMCHSTTLGYQQTKDPRRTGVKNKRYCITEGNCGHNQCETGNVCMWWMTQTPPTLPLSLYSGQMVAWRYCWATRLDRSDGCAVIVMWSAENMVQPASHHLWTVKSWRAWQGQDSAENYEWIMMQFQYIGSFLQLLQKYDRNS